MYSLSARARSRARTARIKAARESTQVAKKAQLNRHMVVQSAIGSPDHYRR